MHLDNTECILACVCIQGCVCVTMCALHTCLGASQLEKKVRNELLLQLQKDPDALNKPQDALPEEVPMNYEPSPVNEAKSVPSSIESRVYWPKPPHSQRSSNMFLVRSSQTQHILRTLMNETKGILQTSSVL